MQPEKADAAYLWDMLDAARAIREFVTGKTLHDYLKSRLLRGAVERHVEIKHELLWRVATQRITELIPMLEPLVPQDPGDKGI